jgi:glycosyltransferase involved in cell wall biosynthesis
VKRVLFLAYHFPPVGGAGVQRSVKFARYLPEFGYEPVVVTGGSAAGGRWTPADETLAAELSQETEVLRVRRSEPAEPGRWRARAERWLPLSTTFSRWWSAGAVEVGREVEGVDLVYATMSPFESAEPARKLAELLGVPWVADLRDPWALDEMLVFPTAAHRGLELRRMGRALASASAVVWNTAEAERAGRERFPELAAKPMDTIPNGFDPSDFEGPSPQRTDDAFRIVHTGYLHTDLGEAAGALAAVRKLLGGADEQVGYLGRSHVYLLEAVERVRRADPELGSRLQVHLAGALSESDRAAMRSDAIVVHGYLPHGESIRLMRSADALFLPLHDLPPGRRARIVPGKTYEYLASLRPILAAVPDGDVRDLLGRAADVELCRATDAAGLASAISRLAADGRREDAARGELLRPFERRALTARLAALFDRLIGGASRAPARDTLASVGND